ncbi:MAG: nucleotide sugar dehydrogenase [Candidatus Micrarchaeia archaeon]|jgi:UDPglucose 6-dehydrogenase
MADILVIGLWHLGCVTAACLARKHNVVGYDPNPQVVENLKNGKPPLFEPGLAEAIAEASSRGALSFTSDLAQAVGKCGVVYIAFDTPVDKNDMVDLSPVENALSGATAHMKDGQLVIVSSQVPIGTCRRLHAKIAATGRKAGFCYTPENLRLGSAIEVFMKPERIVFGVSDISLKNRLEDVFNGVLGERMYMNLESAEMVKHAMNSYLATMISFSGEISDLCEQTGANAVLVMDALKKEKRISPHAPISPGLGFGGGTLARDLQILRGIGKQGNVPTLVLDAAFNSNRERMDYVRKRLSFALGGLSGKAVAFFGLTYKPGTDTLRRSLALEVIDSLKPEGVQVRAYDPAIKAQVGTHPHVLVCATPEEAADGADAIVITTAWEQFKSLDYSALAKKMRQPVLIDARNMLLPEKLGKDIRYFGVGVTYG